MKKIYWRSHQIPQTVLLLIAFYALLGMFAVEKLQVKEKQSHYKEKIEAANTAREAFKVLKSHRLKNKLLIDKETDPSESGLIGRLMTDITSNKGHLPAKQTSINPNFSSLIVHYLKKAGVQDGDTVAVGLSGSFPALNISVLAAAKTLHLKPIIISSASASQWGANIPGFSWLDMEYILRKNNIFDFKTDAASLGGVEDHGLGMDEKGKKVLTDTIEKYQIKYLEVANIEQSLEERMHTYQDLAGDRPIKVYINVGGGEASVGKKAAKIWFKPGLNKSLSYIAKDADSVMIRFIEDGIPVIDLTRINLLAEKFDMQLQPQAIPPVGQANIFFNLEYNKVMAAVLLFSILAVLFLFIRSDWGYRILQAKQGGKHGEQKPQQMV